MWTAGGGSRAAWPRALPLLLPLLLAGPGGCLRRHQLFPFGPARGDLELEPGDDRVSPALELSTALRFFDKTDLRSVYVSAPAPRRGDPGPGVWGGAGRPSGHGREEASGRGPCGAGRTWASGAGTDRPAAPLRARALWVSKAGALPPLGPEVPIARSLPSRSSPRVRGPVRTPLPPSGTRYPGTLLSIAAGKGSRHWSGAFGDGALARWGRSARREGQDRRAGSGRGPHWGVRLPPRLSHGSALQWSWFSPEFRAGEAGLPGDPRSSGRAWSPGGPPWARGQATSGSRGAGV